MNTTVTQIALQRVLRLKSGDFISADQIKPEGQYPVYGGNGLRGFTNRWNTEGPIVLIGRQGAQCGNIQIAREKCWVSEHALRCIPEKIYSTNYIRYALEALGLNRYSVSAAQPGLSTDNIKPLRIAFPPLETQQRIAAFLDEKTSQIDALIEKKRALLERLAEKRQAIITQAVTKGLNPAAPMKDSGIEWLGEIPADWKLCKIKFAVSHIVDCLHTTPNYDGELIYPAVRTSDIDRGRLLLNQIRLVSEEVYLERIQRLKPVANDILYSREGERFGLAALVPDGIDLCLGQRMMMFRVCDTMSSSFLMWALNSEAIYQQVSLYTGGSTSPHVNIRDIINFFVPNPPAVEQPHIAGYVVERCSQIEQFSSEVQRSIEHLVEYRSALITAAVTGQIEGLR